MKDNKKTTKKNLRLRLILLYISSFMVSVVPLLVVIGLKWDEYATTVVATVKLCAGGIIGLFFVFLKVIGKLKMPKRIQTFAIIFIFVYLLQPILNDLLLLSGIALASEFVDMVCFQRAIKVTKENITIEKTANRTAEKVEEVIAQYMGNGRA